MGNLTRKIKILFRLTFDFLLSFRGTKKAHFLSVEDTVRECIDQQKSIIRFGDGDFNVMRGWGESYQRSYPELTEFLEAIIRDYVRYPETCPYILCMPGDFLKCSGLRILKRRSYLISWPPTRRYFKQCFDMPVTYGDAFLFAVEYKDLYQQIWHQRNIAHIVFVNSDESAYKEFQQTVFCPVSYVPIPSTDAFSSMDIILGEILSKINEKARANTMVLISAGPCANVLVYALGARKIRAIDTGHCFRNPLHKIIS